MHTWQNNHETDCRLSGSTWWSVYFNVRNLTNAPLRIYLGFPDWPIQREFYDQTYETGIRIKL